MTDNAVARAALESTVKGALAGAPTPANDPKEAEELSRERRQAFNIRQEEYFSARQSRRFRKWAFWMVVLFSLIPFWMLWRLAGVLFSEENLTTIIMSNNVGPSPKIALITGAIVAFLVVFGFLARGAFNSRRGERNGAEGESSAPNSFADSFGSVADSVAELVRGKKSR